MRLDRTHGNSLNNILRYIFGNIQMIYHQLKGP